jgi:hypothetical protein
MRVKIRIKQLERRVSILEAQAHVSAEAEAAARIRELCDFWTSSEINEYVHFLEQDADHHKLNEMVLRSTTRREQYPNLWFGIHQRRGGDLAIPEPWSAEAEIEAIRNDVALMWEWRGLALNLDALTTHDLTILDYLQPKWSLGLAYWNRVKTIATPTEIEAVLAKVLLVARAIERDKSGKIISWENIGRPLNWTDLKLDPDTFPWQEWRRLQDARKNRDST